MGQFLFGMLDCVASKFGLEALVSRAGCEWTGTECAADVAGAGNGLERLR